MRACQVSATRTSATPDRVPSLGVQEFAPDLHDGGFVYWLTTAHVLDAGPLTNLVRFDLSTGGAETVLDGARQAVGGTLFWAESTTALDFSQIFFRANDPPTRLVDTPGSVAWLSADATHVYWLSTRATGAAELLRVARP